MRTQGRAAFGLTALAGVYGLLVLLWVIAIPSVDDQTLLENGDWLTLVIASESFVATCLMWPLLRRRCTTGSRAATAGAWIFAVLFLGFSLFGALTIAAWSLAAAFLLLLATVATPAPAAH